MSILVIGAGELGTAILEALVAHPKRGSQKISVLLRAETIQSADPAKKQSVDHIRHTLGVSVEQGNIAGPKDDLVTVFRNYDTVIAGAGMGQPAGTMMRLAEAALEAGVRRYFPWQFGADYDVIGQGSAQDLFDEMLAVRRIIRAQTNTAWTVVSVGLFMTFLFLPAFGVVDRQKHIARGLVSWDTKITLTLPKDIGTMVAETVFVPEGTLNQVVHIAGDTLSFREIADRLDEASAARGEFTRELWGVEELNTRLAKDPENTMTKYQLVFGAGIGTSWDVRETLNYKRGIRLTSLQEYLKSQC